MTLQSFFALVVEYQPAVLLLLFFAPWVALALCIVIPGRREEPFIFSFNLGMAGLSLLMAVGYLMYATRTGGWARVVQEADILLLLAPCYYVGVSLWVTRLRLPLEQVPAFRAMQGLALIGVGYLGIAWFLSRVRFLIFSYLPLPVLVMLMLSLLGIIYVGYLRLTGKDRQRTPSSGTASRRDDPASTSIDEDLERLRRNLNSED